MNVSAAASEPLDLRHCALFLDFDGTLCPIQDDPDTVHLPDGGDRVLVDLADRLEGALALVSGRDVRDLASRTPDGVWRAGNHGDLILPPGSTEPLRSPSPPAPLLNGVRSIIGAFEGLRLEEKARVLAVHTRGAPHLEGTITAALQKIAAVDGGYRVQTGKSVIELKPTGVDKGTAIRRLMEESPFKGRTPIFFGDDTTDEDGFGVALELGGSAIKVGEGDTVAPHRVTGPDQVWTILKGAAR
jgi:trehalose 6-phosphate phosphatase